MIVEPETDRECLGAATEHIAVLVHDRDPELVALAEAHETTDSLADAIRAKPQRDDDGRADDGPRFAACLPKQRYRVNAPDSNCFERTLDYVGAAELIEPSRTRMMETVRTPNGLHTLPIEDGEAVILDPSQSRNAIDAARFHARQPRNGDAATIAMTPPDAIDWIARIAVEPAGRIPNGENRIRRAHRAMRALLGGRPLCVAEVGDVALMLALADREARRWGPMGPRLVATAARATDKLEHAAAQRWQARCADASATRNAPELRIGSLRLRPDLDLLGSIGRVGGRLGSAAALEALRIKLAALGIAPPVLKTVERELNREGLSLGPLAKPPAMLGSLGALTPEALAGRWLASKV